MKLKSLNRYLSFLILFIFCPLLNAEEEIDIWNKTKEEKSKVIIQKKKNLNTINNLQISNSNNINNDIKIDDKISDSTKNIKIFGIYDPSENDFNLRLEEVYITVSLIYYLISQGIFFYILYTYSIVRENIHIYINSINFINKYVKRTDFKKITTGNRVLIIEEESATTLDWMILDRLTKENWIDFTILGVSTRDGSLLKKVLTFSTIFYTLLRFF